MTESQDVILTAAIATGFADDEALTEFAESLGEDPIALICRVALACSDGDATAAAEWLESAGFGEFMEGLASLEDVEEDGGLFQE